MSSEHIVRRTSGTRTHSGFWRTSRVSSPPLDPPQQKSRATCSVTHLPRVLVLKQQQNDKNALKGAVFPPHPGLRRRLRWASPPRPVRRSGASVSAACWHRRGAPGALWSRLSERLPARAPSSLPGVSEAPPPDTFHWKKNKDALSVK